MNSEPTVQGALALGRGGVLRIKDGRDTLLQVSEGSLWLTQEGDSRDYHIGAGRSFRLDRNGVALVHALERSVLLLAAPQADPRSSFGARLRRLWTGLFAPHARPTTAAL